MSLDLAASIVMQKAKKLPIIGLPQSKFGKDTSAMAKQQSISILHRWLAAPQLMLLGSHLHKQLGFQVIAALLLPGEVLLALLHLALGLPQLLPHLPHLLQQGSHVCTRSTQRTALPSRAGDHSIQACAGGLPAAGQTPSPICAQRGKHSPSHMSRQRLRRLYGHLSGAAAELRAQPLAPSRLFCSPGQSVMPRLTSSAAALSCARLSALCAPLCSSETPKTATFLFQRSSTLLLSGLCCLISSCRPQSATPHLLRSSSALCPALSYLRPLLQTRALSLELGQTLQS